MKTAFPLLSIVLTINYHGLSVGAKTLTDAQGNVDGAFIQDKVQHDNPSHDAGFLHSESTEFQPQRQPRTFFIPIGNFFNKWQKPTFAKATTTTAAPISQEDQIILAAHNLVRLRHNAPLLQFNPTLKALATMCANDHARLEHHASLTTPPAKCPLIADSSTPDAAESFYPQLAADATGTAADSVEDAIEAWYALTGLDCVNMPIYNQTYEQKAQLLWKASLEVGCARSSISTTTTPSRVISCIYSPPGNTPQTADAFRANIDPTVPC